MADLVHVDVTIRGDGPPLDLSDRQAFEDACGAQFLGWDGGEAVVRSLGGEVQHAREGWVAVPAPGGVIFVTPAVLAALGGAQAARCGTCGR